MFSISKRARMTLAGILAAAGISTIAWNNTRTETVPVQTGTRIDTVAIVKDTIAPGASYTAKSGDALERVLRKQLGDSATTTAYVNHVADINPDLPHLQQDVVSVVRDDNTYRVVRKPDGKKGDVWRVGDETILREAITEERAITRERPVYELAEQKAPANYTTDLLGILLMSGAILAGTHRPDGGKQPDPKKRRVEPKPRVTPQNTTLPTIPASEPIASIEAPVEEHIEGVQQYEAPLEITPPPMIAPPVTLETAPQEQLPRPIATEISALPADAGLSDAIEHLQQREKSGAHGDKRQVIDVNKLDPRLRATTDERAAARALVPKTEPSPVETTYNLSEPVDVKGQAQELPRVEEPIATRPTMPVHAADMLERPTTRVNLDDIEFPEEIERARSITPRASKAFARMEKEPETTEEQVRAFLADEVMYKPVATRQSFTETENRRYYAECLHNLMLLATASMPRVKELMIACDPDVEMYIKDLRAESLTPHRGSQIIKSVVLLATLANTTGATEAKLEERIMIPSTRAETTTTTPQHTTITYVPRTHTAHVNKTPQASKEEKLAAKRAAYQAQMDASGVPAWQQAFTFGEQDDIHNPAMNYKDVRSIRRSYTDQMRAQGVSVKDIAFGVGVSTSTVYRDLRRQNT